ncbi:TetR/AcrR family transcriptional regulator [Streptacidiphilus pinicola]|uniref:TetR/AcrR family transcriptional regulator n=1 Tax=Streptacidiphilus pinicola TaxID=2219663 RepID=A0A2X0K5T3_9ACTN|nr:TetR/AcrR family transcriptional regulator [Streptacidiphilus pinicola]RAG82630.1 TetR/AcrR family transcriptional regulator [Streptacidiphilus pinicola]
MFSEHVQSRAERREGTRRKVLASAERLFREQGFGATTVRQIAADAEVSTGTVMAVGDKDALLVAIFDGWIGAVHRERGGALAQSDGALTPAAAVQELMALVAPFITYFESDRELSREYAAIIVRGSHTSEVFVDLALALLTEFTSVLSRAGLSAADAGRGAQAVYFAYLGLLMTASHGVLDEQAAVAQLQEIVRFVVRQDQEGKRE